MTREEQIENFANSQVDCEFFNENLYNGILIGAKWSDENPKERLVSIDKACRWLKENANPVFYNGNGWTTEEFIENFRKAMEK